VRPEASSRNRSASGGHRADDHRAAQPPPAVGGVIMSAAGFEIVEMTQGATIGSVERCVRRDGRAARITWRSKGILVIESEDGIAEPLRLAAPRSIFG
jgi:hypothetical protein